MQIITPTRLNRALADVIRDFESFGIWNEVLAAVEVKLVPVGMAYGYKYNGADGAIEIPAVSIHRLCELFGYEEYELEDILRHEYGHAIADLYPRLTRTWRFRWIFAGSYDRGPSATRYHPGKHITPYAASEPAEDFCEVFTCYVKHRGKRQGSINTFTLWLKWFFVGRLLRAIRRGCRTG